MMSDKLPPAERAHRLRGLQEFHQHCLEGAGSGGGAMQAVIVRVEQFPAFLSSPEPLHRAIAQTVIMMNEELVKGTQVLCLLCEHKFGVAPPLPQTLLTLLDSTIPPAYLILFPYRLDIKYSLPSPLCESCSQRSDADVLAAATVKYRETWPQLRQLVLCPSPTIEQ